MKRIVFSFVFALAVPFMACADNKPVDVTELPARARGFIEQHFAGQKIMFATVDREFLDDTTWEVVFADGSNVDFDRRGDWKDIDVRAGVPTEIVPEAIRNHIAANFPDRTVRGISRDRRDWEVELDRGLELTFDTKFRLRELDN